MVACLDLGLDDTDRFSPAGGVGNVSSRARRIDNRNVKPLAGATGDAHWPDRGTPAAGDRISRFVVGQLRESSTASPA